MNLFVLLQVAQTSADVAQTSVQVAQTPNYFDLLMKGGWILVPIFLLSILSVYVMIDRWLVINKLGKKDSTWMSRVLELIHENKIEKALRFVQEKNTAAAKVISAGLKEESPELAEVEEAMQVEARQQVSALEHTMNYLGITASIAPMLGFLGTIFGVIHIFYNISMTNELSIDTISAGLYQKMICSGAGLFVGIIAYAAYYVLNGRIDKIVVNLDKESNDALKAIRSARRAKTSSVSSISNNEIGSL